MKKSILALLLICHCLSSWSGQEVAGGKQNQSRAPLLEGRVGDFFHKPVSGAKVVVEGTKWQTQTDEQGKFEPITVTPGIYTIRITHPQYKPLICKNFKIGKEGLFAGFELKKGSPDDTPVIRDDRPLGQFVIDEDAEPIIKVEPVYPESALKDRIEGTVSLNVNVSETGEVLNAWVAQGVREDLNHAALEAIQNFKFKPAKVKGKPVPVPLSIPFNFKLADKSSEYPFKLVNGPLTNEDISSALDYLGVQMYRFSYEIPFKHKLRLCLDRYLDGKLIDSKSTGSGPQDPGKNNVTIFKYTKDDSVQFTFSLSSAGSAKRITFNKISVKEYPSAGWIPYFDVHMQSGKKTPFYMFALSSGALKFSKDEPLDSIISKIKFVVVGSVELRLD
ncbi:MAG: TonB family protein [Ignavibacteriales bacterium]|nr:TonB family protein [Ignavibacteriales bacterium]